MNSSRLILHQALPWLLLLLLGITRVVVAENEEYQTYIIHMDHSHKPESFSTHESWHRHILRSSSPPNVDDKDTLLYSYSHGLNGFSARLTSSQLSEIQKSPAHVATYPETFGKLYTTHSPRFLGLKHDFGLWPNASYGEGVIIGVIDTGIWPESESFSDKGMPPVPQRWKGKCENGTGFSPSLCNKKLIGAQYFNKGISAVAGHINEVLDFNSPRDFSGHGTHVSSIAAGNHVDGVSHFGYARGTAKGVAPRAHVAMYKVFFSHADSKNSAASDVLAGMDQAIADGVDIMSLSLGFENTAYFNDVVAIASLSATEKGIIVVGSGANEGIYNSTHNGAPWITTVGAGTLDRSFNARITLESGLIFEGISYYPESLYITNKLPYWNHTDASTAACKTATLNQTEVQGNIVFCDSTNTDIREQTQELLRVGALFGVFITDKSNFYAYDFTMPSIVLNTSHMNSDGNIDTTTGMKSVQFVLTTLGTRAAPEVASFSSRGPDPITPGILKPDIIAPGVDVLGAFVPNIPYMMLPNYALATDYALRSGTSTAAPHVAGVAALLKAVHPEWSPAAIRSALMTTAHTVDNTGRRIGSQGFASYPSSPLDFGAGHINPNQAMDPGLIYDLGPQDYIDFLCGIGYSTQQMSAVLRRNQWNCQAIAASDLNYPSFIGVLSDEENIKNFTRVVTNVGNDSSIYFAIVETPPGMVVKVYPGILNFTQKYQKLSFVVVLEIDEESSKVEYGFLRWIDQWNHIVASPIVALHF
ncbi:subtilisin-like protease SBT1.7 [Tripterygium wilfordii]|uniref:Subtilisin-like protease SBT1.7 n=1 Tax=Tripterygium wilfordii TaxID=458696 RepID=A0A7J7DL26_TRIWF|nr:subtilisin-like protease SBT3 [Tripterygium wilfordii]KAF5747008.1 subtilisin-like protease SBT1.7 [Tripterygium wilfordii]